MSIGARTRLAVVLGHPVEHSRSPAVHNAAFAELGIDAVYLALDTPADELATVVRALSAVGALGASVTVPHKQAVLPLCDEVSAAARAIGAVNTLELRGGRIVGHNTDADGFVDSLQDAGFTVNGRRAVLLGGGGAARAVDFGLRHAGAQVGAIVARAPESIDFGQALPWTDAGLAQALGDCDLLVDCTSIGLSPASEAKLPARIPLEQLEPGACVATLIYHRETALLEAARARGLATVDGAGMLLFQAARAFAIWTGRTGPIEVMRAALRSQ